MLRLHENGFRGDSRPNGAYVAVPRPRRPSAPARRRSSPATLGHVGHSAFSTQHSALPARARAVASARQPFSIQHSAFSIRNRRPHAIILRPFASLRAGRPASPASSFPDFGQSEATEGSRASSGSPRLSAQGLVADRFLTLCQGGDSKGGGRPINCLGFRSARPAGAEGVCLLKPPTTPLHLAQCVA